MRETFTTLIVLVLLATACGSGSNEDSTEDQGIEAATTSTTEAADTTNEDVSEAMTDEATTVEFASDAASFTDEFSEVPGGTHRIDTLGTPFSLTFEGAWSVQPNTSAWTVFTDPASRGPGDRDVVFIRPSHLADPDAPNAAEADQTGWPTDDIDGWLDQLIDGVVTSDAEPVEIGGRSAIRFDVGVSDDSLCGPDFCVGFVTNNRVNGFSFEPDNTHTVYWVDQGAEAPVAIIVATSNDAFTAKADELLATLAFGPTEPHPIDPDGTPLWEQGIDAPVPAGPARFPVFGGVSLELDQERFVVQFPDWLAVTLDAPGDVEIFQPKSTSDGAPIANGDDVVAALEAMDLTLTTEDSVDYPLGAARVFSLDRTPGPPAPIDHLKTAIEDERGWQPPDNGRIYVFETDRGPIVVTAESFDAGATLPEAIELAEALLPTVELVDFVGGDSDGPSTDADGNITLASMFGTEASGDGWLLEPNSYSSSSLGVGLVIDVSTDAALMDELPALVAIGRPGSTFERNEATAIFSATGVADAAGVTLPLPNELGSFLDEHGGIEVLDSGTQVLVDTDASWWDVTAVTAEAGGTDCPFGRCVEVFAHATFGHIVVGDAWTFRIWDIDDPDGRVFALTQARPESFESVVAHGIEIIGGVDVVPLTLPEGSGNTLESLALAGAGGAVTLEPGNYETDALPVPISIELADSLDLGLAVDTHVSFHPAGSDQQPPTHYLALVEPTKGFADPSAIGGPFGPPDTFVDVPEDLATWVDDIPQLSVMQSGEGEIGGFEAPWWDVQVVGSPERNGDCDGVDCFVLFDWQSGPWVIIAGSPQRLHIVDHPDGKIVVAVEAPDSEFEDWRDEVEPVINSIEFG